MGAKGEERKQKKRATVERLRKEAITTLRQFKNFYQERLAFLIEQGDEKKVKAFLDEVDRRLDCVEEWIAEAKEQRRQQLQKLRVVK